MKKFVAALLTASVVFSLTGCQKINDKKIIKTYQDILDAEEQAEKDINKVDKWRDNYVKKYAGTSRYDTRNYDLVINMAELDEDDAVELIMDYIDKSK